MNYKFNFQAPIKIIGTPDNGDRIKNIFVLTYETYSRIPVCKPTICYLSQGRGRSHHRQQYKIRRHQKCNETDCMNYGYNASMENKYGMSDFTDIQYLSLRSF